LTTHWKVTRPKGSHLRVASCREVDCGQYLRGWETYLPVDDVKNTSFIRRSGMRFREEQDGLLIRFMFESGQTCFHGLLGEHQILVERDPILLRDNQVMAPMEWLDRMNDNLYQIRARN
jgi:hypothetical protein